MGIQMTIERKQAYTEILEILNILGNNYSEKVPNKMKKYFQDNCSEDYKFNIDSRSNISEQITNPITINLLGMLRYNYWCNSENEKQELLKKFSENDEKKEQKLRERYNPDKLFENRAIMQQDSIVKNDVALAQVKENFFTKLMKKLKDIFHIK